MASNLECVGLGVVDNSELRRLVEDAVTDAQPLGEIDGLTVLQWQDPSGAKLVLGVRDSRLVDLLPSFAGTPGARLANVDAVNDEVSAFDVVDEDDGQLTRVAVELEQRRLLPVAAGPVAGLACMVGLGVDVTVHADADAFGTSDASLLSDGGEIDDPPPRHVVERGGPWPPRLDAESIISFGLFASPAQAEAYARLTGTVLHAQRRTVLATGQQFIVARVRTFGFELDICLPATVTTAVPTAGNVIAGTVFLVASLPFPTTTPTTRRFRLPWRR
jgi:hypothetical protein